MQSRYIIMAVISILYVTTLQAKTTHEDKQLIKQVIDWKEENINGSKPDYKFIKKNIQCGNINFQTSKLTRIALHRTIVITPDPKADLPDINIQTNCKLGVVNFNEKEKKYDLLYNPKTEEWSLTDAGKKERILDTSTPKLKNAIFQIKAKNATGFISTGIEPAGGVGDGSGNDYLKFAGFCLYNKSHTKEFCGGGVTQYFREDTDIGSKQEKTDPKEKDYTPELIKILETAQFDDNK